MSFVNFCSTRTSEVSAATSHIAVVPKVRDWMKKKQRECIQFGSLVREGRDIGTNVFPETDYKFYLDAHIEERTKRRAAEGINENLAARDQRDRLDPVPVPAIKPSQSMIVRLL
jgi:cytidylate kinase